MEAPELQGVERKSVWICAVVVFVVSAGLGFLSSFLTTTDFRSHGGVRLFDSAAWKDKDWPQSASRETHGGTIREEMAGDLITRHLRHGLAKREVKKLVGEPDDGWTSTERSESQWTYFIDGSGFTAYRGVVVFFDAHDELTSVNVARID